MGKIIAIFGPHGVGKTSLQNEALRSGDFSISEGFEFPNEIDECADWEKFWHYQMRYWKNVKENILKIRQGEKDCILSRSFEEQIYYLSCHPLSKGHEDEIRQFAIANRTYQSDLLIYLDADFETLKSRIANDESRDQKETRWWYRDRYYLYNKINKAHEGIHIINTASMTPKDVLLIIKSIIKDEKYAEFRN